MPAIGFGTWELRGQAASGMNRSDLFVTTKIWNDDHGFDRSRRAVEQSRRRLDGENSPAPIDLVLIHWPGGPDRLDTWRQMETLLAKGTVRAITPMANQIEFNPLVYRRELATLDYCRTAAQVLLRCFIQHGVVPLPKSSPASRMAENLAVFDFELSAEDMESLNTLGEL